MKNNRFFYQIILFTVSVFFAMPFLKAENLPDSWDVEVIKKSTNEVVKKETVQTNSFVLEGLEHNVEYYAKIRTRNIFLSGWETSEVFVFTLTANAIASAEKRLVFRSENGLLLTCSDGVRQINIFSVDGRLIRSVLLSKGENTISGLERGVYLIENQKVAIR